MLDRIAADLVLIAHFLFAGFAVLGGILFYWSSAWVWIHLPVVVWSAIVNLMSWTCPLTPVEKRLRARAGQSGYAGGFVEHYVGRLVYPRGMPRELELVAGISITVWNALVYGVAILFLER